MKKTVKTVLYLTAMMLSQLNHANTIKNYALDIVNKFDMIEKFNVDLKDVLLHGCMDRFNSSADELSNCMHSRAKAKANILEKIFATSLEKAFSSEELSYFLALSEKESSEYFIKEMINRITSLTDYMDTEADEITDDNPMTEETLDALDKFNLFKERSDFETKMNVAREYFIKEIKEYLSEMIPNELLLSFSTGFMQYRWFCSSSDCL